MSLPGSCSPTAAPPSAPRVQRKPRLLAHVHGPAHITIAGQVLSKGAGASSISRRIEVLMRRFQDYHPLLFGIFPVLFAAAHNRHVLLLDWAVFGYALLIYGAAALGLRGSLRALLRSKLQASLCASLVLLSLSSYGIVDDWVSGPQKIELGVSPRHVPTLLWIALLGCLCYLVARMPGDGRRPTHFANLTGAVLAACALLQIAFSMHRPSAPAGLPEGLQAAMETAPPQGASQPDIYYIILERYGSAASLRESLRIDNEGFINDLRQTGFYVADESHANYGFTVLSLASSLHMQYLDGTALTRNRDPSDLRPIYDMLQDYPVWRFLRARGYRFIHLGGWYDPLRANASADISLNWDSRLKTEFTRLLWEQTLPAATAREAGLDDPDTASLLAALPEWAGLDGLRHAAYFHAPYQFEQLLRLSDASGPKFVFVHLLVTHPPYVFGRDGSFLRIRQVGDLGEAGSYAESMEFCNRNLREVLPKLLAGSSVPPIVILQADEGPYPERCAGDEGSGLGVDATDAEVRLKYGILNAYYVPAPMRAGLYPTITPVNSFRLLFNTCFGADLPLLPDVCYRHERRRLDTLAPLDRERLAQPRPVTSLSGNDRRLPAAEGSRSPGREIR